MALSIDPIRPYLPLVYGGIVLVIAATIIYQHNRIGDLKDERAERDRWIAGYAEANATNMKTIETLEGTVEQWKKRCSVDPEAMSQALADLEARNAETQTKNNRLEQELENVYARSPEARKWGRTGVPRDVASRLPNTPARRKN